MITSQIRKFRDSQKSQKSEYLQNKTFFSSNKKNSLITHEEL